jgi:hypothetical protein
MDALLHVLPAWAGPALLWFKANWFWLLLGVIAGLSLANKLWPGHPRLASASRMGLDLLALMPMPKARSALLLWLASKVGDGPANQFLEWLAKYLNIPFSPSVPDGQASPGEIAKLTQPRGHVAWEVMFALIGALVAGKLLSFGYPMAAAIVALAFLVLLALRRRAGVPTVMAIVLLASTQTGCASWRNFWSSNRGAATASALAHCAGDAASSAIGPLIADVAEAALHGDEVQWASEWARLKAIAGDFKDCLALAAFNAAAFSPHVLITGPGTDPRPPIGFKPSASSTSDSAGASRLEGILPGLTSTEPHTSSNIIQAKLRLRAALQE